MTFKKKEWVAGVDDLPGAGDMNRIEQGIADAHNALENVPGDSISALVAVIPKLEAGAKVADVVSTVNQLIDVLSGVKEPE